MDQFHHYKLLHTSHKTVLRNTIRLPSLCITVDLYGFKCTNFVAMCTDDSPHRFLGIAVLTTFMEMLLSVLRSIWLSFWMSEPCSLLLLPLQGTCCSQSVHWTMDCLFWRLYLNMGQLLLNFQHVNNFFLLRASTTNTVCVTQPSHSRSTIHLCCAQPWNWAVLSVDYTCE
jgi:hypothetical protein